MRLLSGLVFVGAGVPKFAWHSWETGHFRTYGLPFPDAFVFIIGFLEIAGGIALLAGFQVRATALLLGAIMVGAIVTSGIGQGEWIPSLTLAPALLAAMVYLLWVGGPEAEAAATPDRAGGRAASLTRPRPALR